MGYGIDEWQKLPWWHTWLYVREFKKAQEQAESGDEVYDRDSTPVSGDISDLSDLGIDAPKVQKM